MKSFIALVLLFAVAAAYPGGYGGYGYGGYGLGYGRGLVASSPNYLTHANSMASGSVSGPVRGGFYSGYLNKGYGGYGGYGYGGLRVARGFGYGFGGKGLY